MASDIFPGDLVRCGVQSGITLWGTPVRASKRVEVVRYDHLCLVLCAAHASGNNVVLVLTSSGCFGWSNRYFWDKVGSDG